MVDRQSKPVLVGVDVHIEQRQAFIKSTEKKKKKKKKKKIVILKTYIKRIEANRHYRD